MNNKESDIIPYHASGIPAARGVLVFAPHPDDEVFGCGGALALHARANHAVHVILLTAGDSKPVVGTDASYANLRLAESGAAAAVLGIPAPECWGLLDRTLGYGEVLVQRIMSAIEAVGADTIYAPSVWESHPDHRATSMSTIEAMRRLGGDRQLYLYEVSAPLRPNRLIDISTVWAEKSRAMACFISQNGQLDYPDFIGSLNRYRAMTLHRDVTRVEAYEVYQAASLNSPATMPFASERRRLQARGLPSTPQDLPLVSVVVRSMARPTLSQTIDSLIAQTYTNIELILVDVRGDGLQGVNQDGIGFPYRIVGSAAPLGRAQAANLGLENSNGAFCIFLDDDDWFYADHLAKLVNYAMQNRAAKAVHTAVACVDGSGNPTGTVFDFPYAQDELKFGNFLPIHSVLFSRQLVAQGCRFDEQFDLYEDWDFWLQVEEHTPFAFVPGVSAAYRIDAVSGAGVQVDPEMARQATAKLYAKWDVFQTEPIFQALITRALSRRQVERELAGCQRELAGRQRELTDRQSELVSIQHQRQALEQEVGRLNLLAIHQQERADEAERATDQAQQQAQHLRQAHDQACHDRDKVRSESELVQQQIQAGAFDLAQQRAQVNAMLSSTSWRLTRPVRGVGAIVRKVKTVATAISIAQRRQLGWTTIARRALQVFQREGLSGVRHRVAWLIYHGEVSAANGSTVSVTQPQAGSYADWLAKFDSFDAAQLDALHLALTQLTLQPLISIVMPVHNPVASDLTRAIESVMTQIYPHWELCICDDASTEPHVKKILDAFVAQDKRVRVNYQTENGHISKASNAAIAQATGQYIAFLDHDDELSPHALLRVAQSIARHPEARVFYSDEDKIDAAGRRFDPYFKPDFNLGLLRSHNYMCHFAVYEARFLNQLGGLREGFEGAQDYDLALRAVDTDPGKSLLLIERGAHIIHIPHILYHWRTAVGSTAAGHNQKSYAFTAGQHALAAHLERRALLAAVGEAPEIPGMYRIRWTLPKSPPLVSIVIPTRNGEAILRQCLDSLKATSYPNYETIVVDNGSDDPGTLALLAERTAIGQIRVLHDDRPFNFSALNNRAVNEDTAGEFVLLLNNDIEVMNHDWLDEMVGPALESGMGCVGARLWYPDGRLQHGGVILVGGVAGHAHKYLPRGHRGYMGRAVLAQDMAGVTAACLLVRKKIYLEVGGLDEGLAVAFNDVDFCLRVRAAGYRNHWTPYAELIHHESLTRGHEDTPEKRQRFRSEIKIMQTRWPDLLVHDDPCYSPNLTSAAEDLSLAWPPRRELP